MGQTLIQVWPKLKENVFQLVSAKDFSKLILHL